MMINRHLRTLFNGKVLPDSLKKTFGTNKPSPYFELQKANLNCQSSWTKFLDTVPSDPYLPKPFRFKATAWFRVTKKDNIDTRKIDEALRSKSVEYSRLISQVEDYSILSFKNHGLCQSSLYNPVNGDQDRHYPDIPASIYESNEFIKLLLKYANYHKLEDEVILVQFQRIIVKKGLTGHPAVEGFHKDGNKHLLMYILNRSEGVQGGASQISLDKQGNELIFNEIVQEGYLLFVDDANVYHYANPLELRPGFDYGFRDIVLVSPDLASLGTLKVE